jgi:diguanylate cyclase (GGDEF)-like protein/PAS domain S-box-containing protein
LVETATKLGAGDLAARAHMAMWQAPEFRALSKTLGDMADSIAVAQADLRVSESRLRLLAENSTDMILLVKHGGQRLYASPACRKLLGWEPEEMLQISSETAIHPEDVGFLKSPLAYSEDETTTLTYRMRRKDGSYVWVESASRSVTVEPGQLPQRIVIVRDIDLRIAAEHRLKESETRYRFLAEHGTDMVFQLDLGFVRRYASPACREILGYEPEEMVGIRPLDMIHPDDAERVREVFQSVLGGRSERASVINRIRHRTGSWIWVEAQLRALKDPQSGAPTGIIGALRDVSVRKAAEDRLEEANRRLEALAGQDGLTGLANRRAFDDALSRAHRRALRDRSRFALIMIDVDRFKSFNDKYGHPAGDECLKQVSQAIADALRRPGDTAARYGGEEFAVLLPDTDEADAALIADCMRLAVLALAIEHGAGCANVVTISAGVASCAPKGFGPLADALVQDADHALYRAKHSGRNAIACASTVSGTLANERSTAA